MKLGEEAIHDFLHCLREAGSRIPAQYIRLGTADGSCLTHERTYCYELYHRLRECLGDEYGFYLMGEVDKSARWSLPKSRPDFLVHVPGVPGEAGGNLVAMEVKPLQRATHTNVMKDVRKLTKYIDEGRYRLGVLLVYDYANNEQIPRRISQLVPHHGGRKGKLALAWHPGPDRRIQIDPDRLAEL